MFHSKNWNVKKFEAQLAKEIAHRKNYKRRSSPRLVLNHLLFDELLIIGLPPETQKKKETEPKILFAYPPYENMAIGLNKLHEYCLPSGADREYLNSYKGSFIQDEFVFQLTVNFRPLYGICIHVNPRYPLTLASNPIPFYASKNTKNSTFCFCLLTETPAFSSHFSFLSYLALWTVGKIKEPIEMSDFISVDMPSGCPIEGLEIIHQYGRYPGIEVPLQFENEVANYYLSPPTAPPIRYAPNLELRFPPVVALESQQSILWTSLDTLFSVLSPSDILTVYSGLLLDAQVIILGKNLQEVTLTIHALLALMKPFTFQGQIIPLLPITENALELLNSPTPFIIGCMPCPALNKFEFSESTIIVDLDKHSVPPVDYYPQYPSFQDVTKELNSLLTEYKNSGEMYPYAFPSIFGKFLGHKYAFPASVANDVIGILQGPFQNILTEFLICFFVTDMSEQDHEITMFNKELFLGQVPESELQFWDMLMDSSSFQEYIEDRILAFVRQKGSSSSKMPERRRRSSVTKDELQQGGGRRRRKSIYVSPGKDIDIVFGEENAQPDKRQRRSTDQ